MVSLPSVRCNCGQIHDEEENNNYKLGSMSLQEVLSQTSKKPKRVNVQATTAMSDCKTDGLNHYSQIHYKDLTQKNKGNKSMLNMMANDFEYDEVSSMILKMRDKS